MANLTSEQAVKLANDFLGISQAVGEYRYLHYNSLTEIQNRNMKDMQWSILNYSDDLYTLAATLVMNDVESSLLKISTVAADIKKTYHTLQKVQKVIDVAASAVTLGASIISKNPQAIAEGIAGLVKSWKSN